MDVDYEKETTVTGLNEEAFIQRYSSFFIYWPLLSTDQITEIEGCDLMDVLSGLF